MWIELDLGRRAVDVGRNRDEGLRGVVTRESSSQLTRAAPAKKRMLSEHTGISSRAYDSGLPTLRDSTSASSSACSSIASASFNSISARSPGVVSSHSGSAFFAA